MVVGQRRRVQTTRSFLASASAAVPSCASASSRLVPRLPSPTLPPPLPVQWFGARPPTPFRVRPTRVVAGKGAYMQCPAQHTERCGLARPDGGEDSVWARRQTCCCKRTDRVTPDRLMTAGSGHHTVGARLPAASDPIHHVSKATARAEQGAKWRCRPHPIPLVTVKPPGQH